MRYQGHLRPERCCASSLPPTLPPPLFFPPPSSLFPFLPNPPLLPLPFPQWQHPAPTNPSLDHHPHPHPLLNQSHQTRNKPPGTAMKCLRPFYLSRSPYPHLPPPSPPPPFLHVSPLLPRVYSSLSPCRFNIFLLDYCKKRGYHNAASQLVAEADLPPESEPPINAQQGLLFESVSPSFVVPLSRRPARS
jgi:hypothetical protein